MVLFIEYNFITYKLVKRKENHKIGFNDDRHGRNSVAVVFYCMRFILAKYNEIITAKTRPSGRVFVCGNNNKFDFVDKVLYHNSDVMIWLYRRGH